MTYGALFKYKFPNLPYYRVAADQVIFLVRPRGRLGLFSTGFFLGLPRFLGSGLGTGFESSKASSSSNTYPSVCTQKPSSAAGSSGESIMRYALERSSSSSP